MISLLYYYNIIFIESIMIWKYIWIVLGVIIVAILLMALHELVGLI
jgi:hypothetical protein